MYRDSDHNQHRSRRHAKSPSNQQRSRNFWRYRGLPPTSMSSSCRSSCRFFLYPACGRAWREPSFWEQHRQRGRVLSPSHRSLGAPTAFCQCHLSPFSRQAGQVYAWNRGERGGRPWHPDEIQT
ncbi:hypothetical protein M011DRAFT_342511 [Sporormia fimetaria CBS 119925]|uniref:Uncharacterized protein n=1 Tax=Sporormia fimetaria CBS 119925 TaxID=1340428 RepID=A0A6A6VCI8_9PLEO|nr:hypothetical protein M011DRAFT_342511 [Sporormia fimetaria CBS 119925]